MSSNHHPFEALAGGFARIQLSKSAEAQPESTDSAIHWTISKDHTAGEHARRADLLAHLGKRVKVKGLGDGGCGPEPFGMETAQREEVHQLFDLDGWAPTAKSSTLQAQRDRLQFTQDIAPQDFSHERVHITPEVQLQQTTRAGRQFAVARLQGLNKEIRVAEKQLSLNHSQHLHDRKEAPRPRWSAQAFRKRAQRNQAERKLRGEVAQQQALSLENGSGLGLPVQQTTSRGDPPDDGGYIQVSHSSPPPGTPILSDNDSKLLSSFFEDMTFDRSATTSFGEGLDFSEDWLNLPPQFMGTATSQIK